MHVVKLLSYIYAHLTLVETQKFECHFKNERGHPNCSHWAGNMSKESGHLTGHLELHQVCYDIQAQPCSKVDYNIYEPRPHKATSAEPRIKFQLVTKPVEVVLFKTPLNTKDLILVCINIIISISMTTWLMVQCCTGRMVKILRQATGLVSYLKLKYKWPSLKSLLIKSEYVHQENGSKIGRVSVVLEPTSQHYQVKTKSSLKNSLNEFGTSKAIDNEKQMGDLAMNIHEQGKDKNLEETSAWPAVNSSSQRCRFSPLLALNPFDDNFSCEMAILEGRIHSDTGQSENPEEHCELCTKTSYKSLSKAESCAVINSLRLSSCYSMPELHESELDPYLDIQETKTLSCNQIHPSDTTRSYVKDLECIWLLTSPSSFYPNGEPLTPPPKSPKRAVSLRSVSYRKDSLTLNIKDNAIRRRPSMIKQASPVHLSEKHFDADGLDDQFESEAGAGEIVFSTSQGPKRKGVLQKLNRFFRGKKNMDRSQRPNKKGRLRKLKRFFILKKDMDRSEETESLIEGKIKRKRFLLP